MFSIVNNALYKAMMLPALSEGMDTAVSSPAGDKGKVLGKCTWDIQVTLILNALPLGDQKSEKT